MKLIVGLGNPGRRYEGTRHNTGFDVLAELGRRHANGRPKVSFRGTVLDADLAGMRALLLCPETFMNRSGTSVRLAIDFYKLVHEELLVVCDDLNLPLGKIRLRSKGSTGGHNGLEDIRNQLASDDYARLRIGIGPVPENIEGADFVLGRFTKQQREVVDEAVLRASDAALVWATDGIDACMNQYN